jgi:pimeloyl-ACP methyl ester carboxylesterase
MDFANLFPPPGQLIDIGDRRLHLFASGERVGNQTVILEAGIASFSSHWVRVQEALSTSTRVVSYDRAGLGWSDLAPEPLDAQGSAMDLRRMLQESDIPGPYVVVGHSYGGLVIRAFADLFPGEVVGMVLVDTSHPDQWVASSVPGGSRTAAIGNRVAAFLARMGLLERLGVNKGLSEGIPAEQAGILEAWLARPQSWSTSADTLKIWDSRSRSQVNQAKKLGDLPLVVISAPERPKGARAMQYAELLNAQQDELAALSSNSLHLWVEGATHETLVGEPESAKIVSDAILKVLRAAETGEPLVN